MMRTTNSLAYGLILVAAVAGAACTGGPGSTAIAGTPGATQSMPLATPTPAPPSGTPSGSPAPTGVTSAAQAAALVFASDPRWTQMVPLRADMVGQSSWYEAFEDGDGFAVSITAGQGDCQAGCIEQHVWHYRVDRAGKVELAGEDGEPVEVTPGPGGDGEVSVIVQLTAGPVCPVEKFPPDPNCAARSVANAEVAIFDADGNQVGSGTSNSEGLAEFTLPAGAYFIVPAAAEGLIGSPEAQAFSALAGDHVGLLFAYDTGIR